MDHLVLDLATPDGADAYFTIYSIALMRGVGSGQVALLRVSTPDGLLDRCFGTTIGLATRMQQRLRGIRSAGGSAPSAGSRMTLTFVSTASPESPSYRPQRAASTALPPTSPSRRPMSISTR